MARIESPRANQIRRSRAYTAAVSVFEAREAACEEENALVERVFAMIEQSSLPGVLLACAEFAMRQGEASSENEVQARRWFYLSRTLDDMVRLANA